jgi:hypothetical protein
MFPEIDGVASQLIEHQNLKDLNLLVE